MTRQSWPLREIAADGILAMVDASVTRRLEVRLAE